MFRFGASAIVIVQIIAAEARGESFESFLEPNRRIELAPAESGLVAQILIKEGDRVAVGQVLASLDKEVLEVSREIAVAASKAVGRRNAAIAELRLRESRLKKLRELHAQGHASHDELQRAETEFASAEGQHRSTEEQQRIDELEVRKTEAMIERRLVRSPIDGVVTKIHHEQGEFVTPVAPTVITVTQLNPLRAVFSLPYAQSSRLRPETKLEILLADEDRRVPAQLEFVSPVIDADSGTVRVKLLIDDPASKLQAGARCFLQLADTDTLTDSLTDNALHAPASR